MVEQFFLLHIYVTIVIVVTLCISIILLHFEYDYDVDLFKELRAYTIVIFAALTLSIYYIMHRSHYIGKNEKRLQELNAKRDSIDKLIKDL